MATIRDPAVEAGFLEAAAAGNEGFLGHVRERLEFGQEMYGDAWAHKGCANLLKELREEAADIGTWGVLAAQTLDELPADVAVTVERMLLRAVTLGAQAHEALTAALDEQWAAA